MAVLLGSMGSGIAMAQACPENWTLNIEENVPLCAYPMFVQTIWGPAPGTRSPLPSTTPGFSSPGNYIIPAPTPRENFPFRLAQISMHAFGDPIASVELKVGQDSTINIGCCCCVHMEVAAEGDCFVINVRREPKCP